MQLLIIAANFQQFRAGRKPEAPEHKCEELNMKDTCPGAAPGRFWYAYFLHIMH